MTRHEYFKRLMPRKARYPVLTHSGHRVAIGAGTFLASAGAGVLWMAGGPSLAFAFSACVAIAAILVLLIHSLPQAMNQAS